MFEASVEKLISKYPWTSNLVVLKDNGSQALASQCNLEARQLKENNFVKYDKCSQDMLDKNVVSEISPLELKARNVPVNWNTHHYVLKDSTTTPIRIESNSSFPNGSTALTNMLVKGPNTLDSLFTNLVRFRDYKVAQVGNISKVYNGMKSEKVECHA